MDDNQTTRTEKGVSLARGPALILGTILLAAGLYFLYKQHTFVKLSNFPSGRAAPTRKVFLGIFGVNGWTGELAAVAGGLLLFNTVLPRCTTTRNADERTPAPAARPTAARRTAEPSRPVASDRPVGAVRGQPTGETRTSSDGITGNPRP